MSDMHCHIKGDDTNGPDESFLRVHDLRIPAAHHPIEALLQLIRSKNINVSALLLPGDFGNKASTEGLAYGWDVASEVGRSLKAATIVPALGNHDVDSHKLHNVDPTFAARFIRPGFPFVSSSMCGQFFSDGFCLIKSSGLEVVVINTVIGHLDPASAKRGSFPIERIQQLRAILPPPNREHIRIALMHHHPVLHSSPFLNENDVIEGGDQLLAVLREKGVGLVVHGHKHQCRLTTVHTHAGEIAVFAAGSFSAMLGEIASVSRNLFHIVDLQASGSSDVLLRGSITNWEWAKGTGWVEAKLLPFKMGFGRSLSIDEIVTRLYKLANSRPSEHQFEEVELLRTIPDLQYLMEDEFKSVVENARAKHRLELALNQANHLELGRLAEKRKKR